MNLKEIIESIILPFEFAENDKNSIINNLVVIIAFTTAGIVSEREDSVEAKALNQAINSNDADAIESSVNKIMLDPSYNRDVNKAFNQVMKSWLAATLPTISPDKQEKVKNSLNLWV